MASKKELEAIYPLSAMQEGMLFHTLYEPQSAMYFEQLTFSLQGQVQDTLLRQAWQRVLDHHTILRTAFVWKKQEKPLQVVFKEAELPWQSLDWRHLSPAAQADELERYLREERTRGFDLSTPPLCRATLIRLGEESYRFVWSNHHLLLDGWSLPILLQEAFTGYEALVRGQGIELPPARPYQAFINWVQAQELGAAKQFWQASLAGFDTPVSLVEAVTGTPQRIAQEPGDYRAHRFSLPAPVVERLQQLARQERLTFSTLLYGAWAILMQRYSGKADVLFGITVAGRPHELPGVERMVGLFINTLPLRVQVPPHTALGEWLRTLQTHQVELREYEHTPLRHIQEWSESPAGRSLFDSLLVFENYPIQAEQLNHPDRSLTLSDFKAEERTNYPLTVVATLGDQLEITFLYNSHLLDQAQMERLGDHLGTLLGSFPESLARPLHTLPMLTEDERERLLHRWNETAHPLPHEASVPRLIEAQARRQPEALAVQQGERALCYAELDRRASQLARTLQGLGVGADARVAVCLDSTIELPIAMLATWKAGGSYLALDPTLPKERLAFMLADGGAAALLTLSRWKDQLPPTTLPTLLLDQEESYAADESPVVAEIVPENLAYIIYTSGSTGTPKGVAIPHRGLLNLVSWYIASFGLSPVSRATQLSNPAFDASVLDIWPCLVAGGSLHFPPAAEESAPPALLQWMKAAEITHSFMVTPLAESALQQEWPSGMALEYLLTGGDRLRLGKPAWLPCPFMNLYGPTEVTVAATAYPVQAQPLPPIGRPLWNTQVYLLDEQQNLVPEGVPGEVYVGSLGLARGYINRPDQTAERFIPNPFSKEEGDRLYRTGDIARYLPDGTLVSMGRADSQVKILGYRIELGEIEATLAQHPAVEKALVTVWQNRAGSRQLLAYFTSKSKIPPSLRELERFLKQRLPGYMLPKSFFVLKEFPRTATGSKIDLKALPVPEEATVESDLVAPRTDIETQLVALWQQVLKIERLGIQNNFFELGGDSILCIQLVSRASQAGLHFTVKEVFRYPTIAELAPHVSLNASVVVEQGDVVGPFPLTPVLHWFFEQALPTPGHYNQSFLLVERQPMEPKWVEQAINHLVRHHDGLRTRFERGAVGWEASVAAPGQAVDFSVVDLSQTADEDIPAAIERVAREAQESLDLASGLPMRCVWFDMGGARPNRFLWVIHHLVVDGLSWRILLEDLQTAYHQCRRGEAPRLPAKSTSFKHWAERLSRGAEEEGLFANERDRWLALLVAPIAHIPVDYPAELSDNTEATVAAVDVALSVEETQQLLQEVPQALNTSINDILLTALALTLAEWSGSEEVLVDLEGHGRLDAFSDVDLSRTVGWFTTIYPVRLRVLDVSLLGEALKGVKGHLHEIAHQGAGFGYLRYMSPEQATRSQFAALPKAEVRFNYMGQYDQSFDTEVSLIPAQEPVGPSIDPNAPRTHLLDIAGGVLLEQLRFTWMYSTRIHRAETVKRLATRYVEHLRQLVAYAKSSAAPIMTPTDFPSANLNQQQLDQFLTSIQAGFGQE